MSVLQPGRTCWRIASSPRLACLVDNEAYYTALASALLAAKRSIFILGWAFDPRTRLAPDGTEGPNDPDEIGRVLAELCQVKPELEARLLIWRAPLSVNGYRDIRGRRAKRWFAKTPVIFREAQDLPFGACHHQKMVIIDDQIAFCGGGDIVTNRWDTQAHSQVEPRRILPDRTHHAARHEVTMLVEGDAAHALGELFRKRWANATGEALRSPRPVTRDAWPRGVPAQVTDVQVGIARTEPKWRGRPAIDEIRQLTLACIATAGQTIYLENQYFTCAAVADALASRLGEPRGPEVILIVNARAPSWFDQLTMDHARNPLIRRLRVADKFGRFRAFSPRTSAGARIIVHSKVGVFDDQVLRVGSANMNNRSGGFDTECDLAFEGKNQPARKAISEFRDLLLSHYLAVEPAEFRRDITIRGGLIAAIDGLNQHGRLVAVGNGEPTWWEGFVSSRSLGDPANADESWRIRARKV